MVDGAPKIVDPSVDPDEDLIEMPRARMLAPTLPDALRVDPAELERPATDRFIGDVDAALGEEILYIAKAQREPELSPDGVLDDLGRKAMASVGQAGHSVCYNRAGWSAIGSM